MPDGSLSLRSSVNHLHARSPVFLSVPPWKAEVGECPGTNSNAVWGGGLSAVSSDVVMQLVLVGIVAWENKKAIGG